MDWKNHEDFNTPWLIGFAGGGLALERGFCSFVFPLAAKAAPQELNDHGGFLGGGRRRRPMMKNAYTSLALQTLVGGLILYLVMFVMIDSLGDRKSTRLNSSN